GGSWPFWPSCGSRSCYPGLRPLPPSEFARPVHPVAARARVSLSQGCCAHRFFSAPDPHNRKPQFQNPKASVVVSFGFVAHSGGAEWNRFEKGCCRSWSLWHSCREAHRLRNRRRECGSWILEGGVTL